MRCLPFKPARLTSAPLLPYGRRHDVAFDDNRARGANYVPGFLTGGRVPSPFAGCLSQAGSAACGPDALVGRGCRRRRVAEIPR